MQLTKTQSKIFSTAALLTIFAVISTFAVLLQVSFAALYIEYTLGCILTCSAWSLGIQGKFPKIFWVLVVLTSIIPIMYPALEMITGVTWANVILDIERQLLPFTFLGTGTIFIAMLLPFGAMIIANHISSEED